MVCALETRRAVVGRLRTPLLASPLRGERNDPERVQLKKARSRVAGLKGRLYVVDPGSVCLSPLRGETGRRPSRP